MNTSSPGSIPPQAPSPGTHNNPKATTATARKLAIRSHRQNLKSRSRSRSNSTSRGVSIEKGRQSEDEECILSLEQYDSEQRSQDVDNGDNDCHQEELKEELKNISDQDINELDNDSCERNKSSDLAIHENNKEYQVENAKVDETNTDQENKDQITNDNDIHKSEIFVADIDDESVQLHNNDSSDNNTNNSNIVEIRSSASENQTSDEIQVTDLSYDTRSILLHPPKLISKNDEHESNTDDYYDENTTDNNDMVHDVAYSNEFDKNYIDIKAAGNTRKDSNEDDSNDKSCEQCLLDDHSLEDMNDVNKLSQQERIDSYNSYVTDSDSEEEDLVETMGDNEAEISVESDCDDDEDDNAVDIAAFQSYTSLNNEEEELAMKTDEMFTLDHDESHQDRSETACFAQFDEVNIQLLEEDVANTSIDKSIKSTNEDFLCNDPSPDNNDTPNNKENHTRADESFDEFFVNEVKKVADALVETSSELNNKEGTLNVADVKITPTEGCSSKVQDTLGKEIESHDNMSGTITIDEACVTPCMGTNERKNLCTTTKRNNRRNRLRSLDLLKDCSATLSTLYYIPPEDTLCPFETTVCESPEILRLVLSMLGDPTVVCRLKCVNRFCRQFISENEYSIMKDSVRIGGIDNFMRPRFWLWITLEKSHTLNNSESIGDPILHNASVITNDNRPVENFEELQMRGKASKWHNIIERDVTRAFGNMPPHKAKSNRQSKSIVRALITWGNNHLRRKVGEPENNRSFDSLHRNESNKIRPIRRLSIAFPGPKFSSQDDATVSDVNIDSKDTVSDWSGISPVNSTVSSKVSFSKEPVLSGRGLTNELKVNLQKKLEAVLDGIAGAHEGVGYCQGMDYLVAHLLRNLQPTLDHLLQIDNLPDSIQRKDENVMSIAIEDDVVVETVFRVMHSFLTTYNMQHMYWPELRCLKTCCRIFERIIEKKLPVLSDHFEYHDLHIGMFALGWFQTLFLYIPSMPAPTINHMWDIWLVERSMKIFFRVGIAILFLSQPILLNSDLEGMMLYLNTFPDATIFNPDILIHCALQIKITNQMLEETEQKAVEANMMAHGIK